MPRTSFDPKRHGFHFANHFVNHVGPFTTIGRCGGMSYAALDCFHHGVAVPQSTRVATQGHDLASWHDNRADLFVRGTDGGLLHRSLRGDGWDDWESLGGVLTSDLTAVSWGPSRLDVFARGTDKALWHKWFDGSTWHDWASLGGVITSGPDACSWAPGRLDVFARGADSALWHRWWDGSTWRDWESLGGHITSDPAAVSWGINRIDVFARGTDNTLLHRWFDGSWRDWESLGGQQTSGPDAASWGEGRLDVFARGTDNALWRGTFDGSWRDWESLGGELDSDPAAVSRGPGRLDVIFRGSDHNLWRMTYDGEWRPQTRVDHDVPVDEHPVARYVYQRQIDSLVSVVPGYAGRLLPWNDDRARFTWSVRETDELGRLRRHLDRGDPVNIALFAVAGQHHQALAIGYDLDSRDGQLRVHIYDPNVPDETVTLTANPDALRFDSSHGGTWHGYFVDEGYQLTQPTF
jgi:hypothetical protein